MRNYENLTIIRNADRNEVRYNFLTDQATLYARDEISVKRGVADLEARGVLRCGKAK